MYEFGKVKDIGHSVIWLLVKILKSENNNKSLKSKSDSQRSSVN